MVPVSDFFIRFQRDFFKNRLKLYFFSSFATSLRNHMGPYGIPGYGSLGILGPDGIPGYGSLGILGPYGIPGESLWGVCRRVPAAEPTGGPWPAMTQRLVVPNACSTPGTRGAFHPPGVTPQCQGSFTGQDMPAR